MKVIILVIFVFNVALYAQHKPTLLANPYIKQYKSGQNIYARNIWDMQLYKGRVYLGAGNSSNKGPAQNAGRVYVVSLDPKNDKFMYEYKIAEEQIDLFKVYEDTLYVPGHDATQKWILGNIYTKKSGKWKKHRTLPKALHVYDLVLKDKEIFAAVGLNKKGSVFISSTSAKTWKQMSHGKGRVYSFLEVGSELFATKTFKSKNPNKLSMTQWHGEYNTFSSRRDLNVLKMFPNTKLKSDSIKIIKSIKLEEKTLYIGAYKHNDHQNKPFGLYKASMIKNKLDIKKIEINKNFIPRDIISRKDYVYILVTKKEHNKNYINVLKFTKEDFSKYDEIISFKYPSFARSFEELNGCFYFGIGSEINNPKNWKQSELKKETGDILKVCL